MFFNTVYLSFNHRSTLGEMTDADNTAATQCS